MQLNRNMEPVLARSMMEQAFHSKVLEQLVLHNKVLELVRSTVLELVRSMVPELVRSMVPVQVHSMVLERARSS